MKVEPAMWSSLSYNFCNVVKFMIQRMLKGVENFQVNLEARIGFSSSAGTGLVEEAKSLSAEFLLLGRPRYKSNRNTHGITKYCFEYPPEGCSIVSVGISVLPKPNSHSARFEEVGKNDQMDKAKRERPSPKRVLDICEGDCNSTEEDSSSFGDSSITTESPAQAPGLKTEPNLLKLPFRRISSFLRSPFDPNVKRKSNEVIPGKDQQKPRLRCFSYEEIAIAHFCKRESTPNKGVFYVMSSFIRE